MEAWVFPGQGSQRRGMAALLSSRLARDTFDAASALLGWDVRSVCAEASDEELGATLISQPAIFTVSVATARSLESLTWFPDAVAGHSVGEFAALVAAHAISFEDALFAVIARARAMARAGAERPGAMAAVIGLTPEQLTDACRFADGSVAIASVNAPGQVVISGERSGVIAASESARAAGARRVIPLDVSVAAHSPLMESAVRDLRQALDGVTIVPPLVPYVSCVSARVEDDPSRIAELLCAALTSPVRWMDTVNQLGCLGISTFREVGPGDILSGLIRRIASHATVASESAPASRSQS